MRHGVRGDGRPTMSSGGRRSHKEAGHEVGRLPLQPSLGPDERRVREAPTLGQTAEVLPSHLGERLHGGSFPAPMRSQDTRLLARHLQSTKI